MDEKRRIQATVESAATPEVATFDTSPILVDEGYGNRFSQMDAPQVMSSYTHQYGGAHKSSRFGEEGKEAFVQEEKEVYAPTFDGKDARGSDEQRRKRKWKWIWISVAAVILIVGIAVGVGIGIGVHKSQADGSGASAGANADANGVASTSSSSGGSHSASPSATMGSSASSAASTTASTNTIPSSTPTATSGTTGIAAFACNSSSISSTYTTSDDTVFMEECYTDYASGSPTWNSTSSEIANLGRATVYSFRACMQACDDYNNNVDPEDTQCMAVSYNANLTYAVQAYGGNCVFKNTRGAGSNGEDGVDYGLVASAYVDCIVDGEC